MVGLAILVLVVAGGIFIYLNRPQKVSFANGMTLEWMGTTLGTNMMMEGSMVQKLLARVMPANGITIGGMSLKPPRRLFPVNESDLTCWVLLRGTDLKQSSFGYYWDGSEVSAGNRSGRWFSNPSARPRTFSLDEVVLAIPLYAFPRDEAKVRLRLVVPKRDIQSGGVAEFEFENPFFGQARPQWKPCSGV